MIIYKCTNTLTGECYIGQTTNTLHNRKVDHIYEAFKRQLKDKFHTALREFGLQRFVWEQIGKGANYSILSRMERNFIILHDSIEHGYNTQVRSDKKMVRK